MYDFIADLDEYFCEKYANYDKLCILPGYKMPKMQTSEVREDGRTYAYTLPANTMRLALQENKVELLALLKTQMLDLTPSFSFNPQSIFAQIRNRFSKYGFLKNFKKVMAKYNLTNEEILEKINISDEIWGNILKQKFLPSKNLILSLALVGHFSYEDTVALLSFCNYEFEYSVVKDVIISYLLKEKIFNEEMRARALAEYKVANLFIK